MNNLTVFKVTYQRLVAAYCQKGDLNGATKILDIMKHKEIPIDAIVFNAIIMGHSIIGLGDLRDFPMLMLCYYYFLNF